MNTHSVKGRWFARVSVVGATSGGGIFALLALGLALMPLPADAGEKHAEMWPTSVQARYRLRYNGIDVGRLNVNSSTTAKAYSVSGSGKVSVLFGTFKWSGGSTVSGAIEDGAPVPASYAFDWHYNKGKKSVAISIGYKDRVAADVAVNPAPRTRPDTVPMTPAHRVGTYDPLSAIMMLTKADGRSPCDRRVPVFDGTQRYDIVFTPKRQVRLPSRSGNGAPEIAHVCRITYEPVAGHRDNADTKAYASNRDVEIEVRRIPGSELLIPYSVTIPTAWGNGTMVTDRIEITTATGKVAFTD